MTNERDWMADRQQAIKAAALLIREYTMDVINERFPTGSHIAEVIIRACPGLTSGQIVQIGQAAAKMAGEGPGIYVQDWVTSSAINGGLNVLRKNGCVLGVKEWGRNAMLYVWVER